MRPRLVADLGGTHLRTAWSPAPGELLEVHRQILPEGESPLPALRDRLTRAPACAGLVLAVAGPVRDGGVRLTNRPAALDERSLSSDLGLRHVTLLNDLEALAHGIPHMTSAQLVPLSGHGTAGFPRVVVAPGTGLGAAALHPAGDRWCAVATEAGHMPLSDQGNDRFEHLLSGPGLIRLHNRCAPDAPFNSPEELVDALAAGDASARESAGRWLGLLGRFTAAFVLAHGAWGGASMAGSLVRSVTHAMGWQPFHDAFEETLSRPAGLPPVPRFLVTVEEAGLFGASHVPRREPLDR